MKYKIIYLITVCVFCSSNPKAFSTDNKNYCDESIIDSAPILPVSPNIGYSPIEPDPSPQSSKKIDVNIDLSKKNQTFDGFAITQHYYNSFSYDVERSNEIDGNPILDDLFSQNGLNAKYIVFRIVTDENSDVCEWWPVEKNFRGGYYDEKGLFQISSPYDTKMALSIANKYKDVKFILRPEVSLAQSYHIEKDATCGTTIYSTITKKAEVRKLTKEKYKDHAKYLIDYASKFGQIIDREIWGLVPQNEPELVVPYDYLCYMPDELLTFVGELKKNIKKSKLPRIKKMKLIGPDVGSTYFMPSLLNKNYFTSSIVDKFDILDYHTWDFPFNKPWDNYSLYRLLMGAYLLPKDKPILAESGNSSINDESKNLAGSAEEMILTSQHIYRNIAFGKASIILWFQALWNTQQDDKNDAGMSLLDIQNDGTLNYQRLPKYYTLMHYSRLLPQAPSVILADDFKKVNPNIHVIAFSKEGSKSSSNSDELAIVITNSSFDTYELTLKVKNQDKNAKQSLKHYYSTYSKRFEQTSDVQIESGSTIKMVLPAKSVHTLKR